MSRPIKFRAWDKNEKRMWWNVQDAYDMQGHHCCPDGPKKESCVEFLPDSFGEVLRDSNFIVMQFTGLWTKNVEIYEDDLIKWWHYNLGNIRSKVEFSSGMFIQYPNKGGASSTLLNELASCEVIGNIYENQELLK